MKNEEEKGRQCSIRLSEDADRLLRHEGLRRGEIGQRIRMALESEDLARLPVEGQSRRPGRPAKDAPAYSPTSVVLPEDLYERVREIAVSRKISMALLIDRAVVSRFSCA